MAEKAVRKGPRVLIVAALESTLAPTTALIFRAAADAGIDVQPRPLLVQDAWVHFQAGESERYIATLAKAIRAAADDTDVVVLAQASMAPVTQALAGLGIDVLSSPELGVEQALALLARN